MEIICVDTNLLIKYFRSEKKHNTRLYELSHEYQIVLPVIVVYEFLCGQKDQEPDIFINNLLNSAGLLPFDLMCAQKASEIYRINKSTGNTIPIQDLLIAATCIVWDYRLATDNSKHFTIIPGLKLLP